MLREPAVAGSFYPAGKSQLESMIGSFEGSEEQLPGVVAAVSPHAGYVYSGPAAGALFASIEIPQTVIILGPNHRGIGSPYGIYDRGAWRTPLGDVTIDEKLAELVKEHAPVVTSDTLSHAHEHSIEVQVPFLQYHRPDVKIVPICIGSQDYVRLLELGRGMATACEEAGGEALILASSDMTHYESAEEAARKDRMAVERMLALDEEGLWRVVRHHDISMCGVAPAVAAIAAARALGAAEGRQVKYMTSGDITGDFREVVGYASVAFMKET